MASTSKRKTTVSSGRKVVVQDNILDENPQTLPADSIVKFVMNQYETIAVHMTRDGKLEIHSEGHGLVVYLSAANEILVQPRGD